MRKLTRTTGCARMLTAPVTRTAFDREKQISSESRAILDFSVIREAIERKEFAMFNWFRRSAQPRSSHLTYPQHYDQTARQAPGEKCELRLIHAGVEGPFINLVYQWKVELSHDEADRLDTRTRAYIACAIYDAATTAGLSCQTGPPHGQRPSWHIGGERIPISLVNAGFDVSDKNCFLQVGPGMLMMQRPKGGGRHSKKLLTGFQAQFRKISV